MAKLIRNIKQEEDFWEVIAKSAKETNNIHSQIEDLVRKLSEHKPHKIVMFEFTMRELISDLLNAKTSAALELIRFDPTMDDFLELATWVILQGRDYYKIFLHNPDILYDALIKTDISVLDGDELQNVPDRAYMVSLGLEPQEDEESDYIIPSYVADLFEPNYLRQREYEEISKREWRLLFPKIWKLIKGK
ncbi:MAG: DUF4240 domain-containing protein [Bacteroidota bacterium]